MGRWRDSESMWTEEGYIGKKVWNCRQEALRMTKEEIYRCGERGHEVVLTPERKRRKFRILLSPSLSFWSQNWPFLGKRVWWQNHQVIKNKQPTRKASWDLKRFYNHVTISLQLIAMNELSMPLPVKRRKQNKAVKTDEYGLSTYPKLAGIWSHPFSKRCAGVQETKSQAKVL